MHTLFLAVLLTQLGCAEPQSIAGVEAACWGQDISDAAGVAQLLAELDPDCAEALAGPVGLKASMDADTTQGWLVAGLYVLWAERSVALVDDWGHQDMPRLGEDLMADAVETQDLAWDGPVGEGWYAYVVQAVQRTEVEPLQDSAAKFRAGLVIADPELPRDWAGVDISHPIAPAMIWIHEASHLGSSHVRCSGSSLRSDHDCDDSEDGAYGIAAFYLRRWMGRHPDGLLIDCRPVVGSARCRLINETSPDWPVCEELERRCE